MVSLTSVKYDSVGLINRVSLNCFDINIIYIYFNRTPQDQNDCLCKVASRFTRTDRLRAENREENYLIHPSEDILT